MGWQCYKSHYEFNSLLPNITLVPYNPTIVFLIVKFYSLPWAFLIYYPKNSVFWLFCSANNRNQLLCIPQTKILIFLLISFRVFVLHNTTVTRYFQLNTIQIHSNIKDNVLNQLVVIICLGHIINWKIVPSLPMQLQWNSVLGLFYKWLM